MSGDRFDAIAFQTGFHGVVHVSRGGEVEFARAYGLAHRGHGIANTIDTRFAIASGTKGLTALVVMSLVDEGTLGLDITAREVLGDDLPLIRDDVTVEHLLAHRSGIGDYFDENVQHDISDYVLPVSVHTLADTEAYLTVLDGFPTKFAPGERFSYNNGGFVVLALIAERASGTGFHDLVRDRVCVPAGMVDTEFLRSDHATGRTALGYLPDGRTNVFHLPVRGTGDGGIYSTAADFSAFWLALFDGRIVSKGAVADMVRPRSTVPNESLRYGLGFWLRESSDVVRLVGHDVGVSFHSAHDPATGLTTTVLSNTANGAWPLVE